MLANWLGFSVKMYEVKVHTPKNKVPVPDMKVGHEGGRLRQESITLFQNRTIIMPQGCTYLKIVFSHKRKPLQIRIVCKVIGNHQTRCNKSLTCDWFCIPINPYAHLHAILLHNMSLSRDGQMRYFKFKRAQSSTTFR